MLFEYINEKTGFAERELFHSGSEVKKYFTIENLKYLFGEDFELDQQELDEMADLVIQKKWHVQEEKSKVFSIRVSMSDSDEEVAQKIGLLKQKIEQFRS